MSDYDHFLNNHSNRLNWQKNSHTFAAFSRIFMTFETFRLIILIQIKRSVIIDPKGNNPCLKIVS